MVEIVEAYVREFYKKYRGKELYEGFCSYIEKINQDEGEVINQGFVLIRDALEILRAKIMAILIDELPTKKISDINIKSQRVQTDKTILILSC